MNIKPTTRTNPLRSISSRLPIELLYTRGTVFQPTRPRFVSTLSSNPNIYIHPTPTKTSSTTQTLTLTPTTPPLPPLALGTTTAIPPTPTTFTENPHFHTILQSVARRWATSDPDVKAQAQAYASQAGASLGVQPGSVQNKRRRGTHGGRSAGPSGGQGGGGGGGASGQGGMGGAGVSGFIHVADQRNPPDWGRVQWPEDILGSLEVDGRGEFEGEGAEGGQGLYQESGTYRICTREGILCLSPFLMERLRERIKELEGEVRDGRLRL
ncbi:MAG: hypothetical protein M1831_005610 [Alyxoria varia]|nr:MAG: hypothetical protein M1831_005610 [Alyxoria varia]